VAALCAWSLSRRADPEAVPVAQAAGTH
jgi:hypothetical protein